MKKIRTTLTGILLLASLTGHTETWMPSFFSDNMVLQQNEEVSVWGKDIPGKGIQISASWGRKAEATTGEDGHWKTKISTPPAGGPYQITIKGSEEIILSDVLIGEVWLCSGQSNMEMPVKGYGNQPINGSNEAILSSRNKQLRVFQIEKNPKASPVDDVVGGWLAASPSTTPDFSATAYFFGELVQRAYNGELDVVIVTEPVQLAAGLSWHPFANEQMMVIAPAS